MSHSQTVSARRTRCGIGPQASKGHTRADVVRLRPRVIVGKVGTPQRERRVIHPITDRRIENLVRLHPTLRRVQEGELLIIREPQIRLHPNCAIGDVPGVVRRDGRR